MDKQAHFAGKKPLDHVVEKQTAGLVKSAEIHGVELPGHLASGTDAIKETSLLLVILTTILSHLAYSPIEVTGILALISFCWLVWKTGRAALLGWQHLERMHRVMEEERWEIEHHRRQERQELIELYEAKGLQGKLLDDVVDVLMSDSDRLLRVMLEEELGLTLENTEHPLLQSLGAFVGVIISSVAIILSFLFLPQYGFVFSGAFLAAIAAGVAAKQEKNRVIPAIIWTLGVAGSAFGFGYFLIEYLLP